jgi:hypothetical protein
MSTMAPWTSIIDTHNLLFYGPRKLNNLYLGHLTYVYTHSSTSSSLLFQVLCNCSLSTNNLGWPGSSLGPWPFRRHTEQQTPTVKKYLSDNSSHHEKGIIVYCDKFFLCPTSRPLSAKSNPSETFRVLCNLLLRKCVDMLPVVS